MSSSAQRIREMENQIHYTSITKKAAAAAAAAAEAEAAQRDSINNNRRKSNGRLTIFNSPLDVTTSENFVVDFEKNNNSATTKTKEHCDFLHGVLQDNFIFTDFTAAERDVFISALVSEKVKAWERHSSSSWFKSFTTSMTSWRSSSASTTTTTTADKDAATIIRQGDLGDYFYIVQKGHVEFERDGEIVGNCTAGGVFGELALLYDCPRAASCIAISHPRNAASSIRSSAARAAAHSSSHSSVTSNHDSNKDDRDNDDHDDDGYCYLWKMDRLSFRHLLARQAKSRDKDIQGLLYSIPIFKDLDSVTMTRFANAMTTVPFKAGDRIVQKGQTGNVFYIIEQGQVKIHDIGLGDSKLQDQILGPGDWFGERALLTGEVRAANATAISESGVVTLVMDRETFEATIGPLRNFVDAEMRRHFLQAIPLFAKNIYKGGHITEPEFQQLVKLMTKKFYHKGERLATAGEVRENDLWIIQTGQLLVTMHKPPALLSANTSDYAIKKPSDSDSASSSSPSKSSSNKMSPFRRFAKSSKQSASALASSSSSTNLSTTLTLKSGDYFFGDEATLKEGLLSAHAAVSGGASNNNNKSSSLKSARASGEHRLPCMKCISTLDAEVGEELTTWVLTLADIEAVLGDLNRLASIVAAAPPPPTITTRAHAEPNLPLPPPTRSLGGKTASIYIPPNKASIEHSNTQIPLDSLIKHHVLGHGAFGKVWLVSYRPIGMGTLGEETYALKVLSKRQLLKKQQHHSVIRERDMLALLQHPFILQLVSSYQDDNNIYLLLPLIHGGELFTLLHKQKMKGRGLDNEKAAFYSACVIEAIGHFHQRLIGTFIIVMCFLLIRFPLTILIFHFVLKHTEI